MPARFAANISTIGSFRSLYLVKQSGHLRANAAKKHENQLPVCEDVARQVSGGDVRIVGVMIESHLVAGRQDLVAGRPLTYGQSITDGCIGWEDTVRALELLSAAVRERRRLQTGFDGEESTNGVSVH